MWHVLIPTAYCFMYASAIWTVVMAWFGFTQWTRARRIQMATEAMRRERLRVQGETRCLTRERTRVTH